MAKQEWERGFWSSFSSAHQPFVRSLSRVELHGFDFRVESENGTKRMIRI